MLKYAFMSEVAVTYAEWERKSISQSTNMRPTSYIQRRTYMTPLILKLKQRDLSLDYLNLTSDYKLASKAC